MPRKLNIINSRRIFQHSCTKLPKSIYSELFHIGIATNGFDNYSSMTGLFYSFFFVVFFIFIILIYLTKGLLKPSGVPAFVYMAFTLDTGGNWIIIGLSRVLHHLKKKKNRESKINVMKKIKKWYSVSFAFFQYPSQFYKAVILTKER